MLCPAGQNCRSQLAPGVPGWLTEILQAEIFFVLLFDEPGEVVLSGVRNLDHIPACLLVPDGR